MTVERGELPPVGVECIFEAGDGSCYFSEEEMMASGKVVSIIAHTKYKKGVGNVAVFKWDLDECRGVTTANAHSFRPIRTERDVLIDMIVSQGFLSRDGTVSGEIADAILAAGFKPQGGEV